VLLWFSDGLWRQDTPLAPDQANFPEDLLPVAAAVGVHRVEERDQVQPRRQPLLNHDPMKPRDPFGVALGSLGELQVYCRNFLWAWHVDCHERRKDPLVRAVGPADLLGGCR